MNFDPDYTKPVQEVFFTRKINKTHHISLMLHNVPVKHVHVINLFNLDSSIET